MDTSMLYCMWVSGFIGNLHKRNDKDRVESIKQHHHIIVEKYQHVMCRVDMRQAQYCTALACVCVCVSVWWESRQMLRCAYPVLLDNRRYDLRTSSSLQQINSSLHYSTWRCRHSADIQCGRPPSYTLHRAVINLTQPWPFTFWTENWHTAHSRSRKTWFFYAFLFSSEQPVWKRQREERARSIMWPLKITT